MKRTTYTILEEPTGEMLEQLLICSLSYCETFSVVVRHTIDVAASALQVLEELQPFLVTKLEESEWPGTELLDETATVCRFKLTKETLGILCHASDSLFSWMQPELPEDLCLFRPDGTPWLVTIAHEKDGYLELSTDEMNYLVTELREIKLSAAAS